jgi:3-dehydroshikimate dehydratase
MLKLAAFADEISPNLDEQIKVCRQNGITHFELRSVGGKNVLDFDKALRNEIKTKLQANGLGVAAIGSPIGKVKIDEPWDLHFNRFKIAVDAAEFFGAAMVRVFSYYPPDMESILDYRDEVLRRFGQKLEHMKSHPNITLIHENERQIYGEQCRECVDLMKSIDSPQLRSAFDFANFVQVGQKPLECWPELKPYTVHIHIKDALAGTGKVVPAGKGDGQLAPILSDAYKSGYRGFLSLEPHLAAHEQFGGFSGAQLFCVAVDALRTLCREIEIPLA